MKKKKEKDGEDKWTSKGRKFTYRSSPKSKVTIVVKKGEGKYLR